MVYVNEVDFNYRYYQENILVVGMIGSGKTHLVQSILDSLPNTLKWIWDESDNFNQGIMVHDLNRLTKQNSVLRLQNRSQQSFDEYMKVIYENALSYELTNLVNVVDEVQKFTNPRDSDSYLFKTVTSMRNRGISNIFITPSPSLIPKWIRENTIHFFGLKTSDYDHLDYMDKNFFGAEAWLLTTNDKRRKLQNEPNLGKYSYIYRNIYEDETQVYNSGL